MRDKTFTQMEDNHNFARQCAESFASSMRDAMLEAFGIDEERVVKFDGGVYPKFGQAVIMSGAGGSGKGYAIEHYIPIDGKHMDVDKFKELYVKMLDYPNTSVYKDDVRRQDNPDEEGKNLYQMGNPEDVRDLHINVKGRRWKEKSRSSFFDKQVRNNPERLPNVILDVTGTITGAVSQLAELCRSVGYTTHLVWVVTSRSRAMYNNLKRERRVPQDIFHDDHNDILYYFPSYLKQEAGAFFDNAWLVFNSSEGLQPMNDEEKMNTCIKLEKSGKGFTIGKDVQTRLRKVLGRAEDNPDNPETYQSFSEVEPHLDRYDYKNARQGDTFRRK